MNKYQELREIIGGNNVNIITEDVNDVDGVSEKTYYLEGIFIQGEVKNLNQRIYPKHEIENAVNDLKTKLNEGKAILGELDHPDSMKINLQNVSHEIKDIYMRGNDGIGRLKILKDLPMGFIAYNLLKNGVKLGVSSRGTGYVDDYTSMVSDFNIVTVDIVATASAPDAYPNAIYENFLGKDSGREMVKTFYDVIGEKSYLDKKYQDIIANDICEYIKKLRF